MATKTKLTEAEKTRRKLQRKADWMNERALNAVGGAGSLFASLAETYTVDDAAEHTRKTRALMVEQLHTTHVYTQCLQLLRLQNIENFAATVLTPEDFTTLRDYCRATFPDQSTYAYSFWKSVLTGEKRFGVGPYVRIEDAAVKCGFRFVQTAFFPSPEFVPAMTAAEFYARWPVTWLNETAGQPIEPEAAEQLYRDVMAKLGI